jgi:hypothetical protein
LPFTFIAGRLSRSYCIYCGPNGRAYGDADGDPETNVACCGSDRSAKGDSHTHANSDYSLLVIHLALLYQ